MGSVPEIIDISSSDEEDDGDWLTAMLDGDDRLEVVVVGEVAARKKGGDDDDDCVVLDGDPEKVVDVVGAGGGGEDELLIVGEKGQLACRDYPHPRHSCATFPFSSTPHEKHCNLCHCYVCDCPAPCKYWSLGVLSTDHCNSTDKETKWKLLRKSFKQRTTEPQLPQKLSDTTLPVRPPLWKSVPVHPLPTTLPSLSSRSSILRPCPTTGIISTRSPTIQRNVMPPIGAPSRVPRLSQHMTRPQPYTPGGHHTLREKRGASQLPAVVMQHQLKIKKTTNWLPHPGYNRPKEHRAAPQTYRSPPAPRAYHIPLASMVEENMKTWQNVLEGVAADLGVSDNDTSSAEAQDTFSQAFSQSAPQTNAQAFMQSAPQTNASQNMATYADSATPSSLGFRYGWSNNNITDQSNGVYAPVEETQPVTVQPSVPGEMGRENLISLGETGPLSEAGNDLGFAGLDPEDLYDFDNPWGEIPTI